AKFQGPEGGVEIVDAHVADGPGAEIPEAAPGEGGVSFVVGAGRRWAEPEVPIESGRNRLLIFGAVDALLPPGAGAVGPDVDFFDVADCAGADYFDGLARAF